MKKWIAYILLALMALTPLPSIGQAQYVTISEMRGQLPEKWTQTYETKWRTVEVDASILLPDVEAVPILKVGYDMSEPILTAEESGWDGVESRDGALILYNDEEKTPFKVNGKPINSSAEAKGVWYSGFAPENTYVPMSDITFGEICDRIRAEVTRFGYDPDDFEIETPTRLWAQHWFFYGHKVDALPGQILMEANAKLDGIPILSHIIHARWDHENGESRTDEIQGNFQLSAGYDGYGQQLNYLFLDFAKPIGQLAEDVPLCPLAQVQAAVEEEINAGHIRKIYEIQLGYALYNEPGVYLSQGMDEMDYHAVQYYAKPVWQVNCLYVRSATGKLRTTFQDANDERNTLDYDQLLVDAQTGELIRESTEKTRCEFQGFLSWEDVGRD